MHRPYFLLRLGARSVREAGEARGRGHASFGCNHVRVPRVRLPAPRLSQRPKARSMGGQSASFGCRRTSVRLRMPEGDCWRAIAGVACSLTVGIKKGIGVVQQNH
jgi:hypothetical protein